LDKLPAAEPIPVAGCVRLPAAARTRFANGVYVRSTSLRQKSLFDTFPAGRLQPVAGVLDFDGVLGVLQEWLGRRVAAVAAHPTTEESFLNVVGLLSADLGMADPYDEAEYAFAVGDTGHFDISRVSFTDADTDDRKLWIKSGSDSPVVLIVELMD
jgi:hypothetical protein